MQPAWREEDHKKQYQKDLLAQMALQKKQAEYAKLKESTDLQAERQRGELHAKQVEQQEALTAWMKKQEQRKQLLEEAERIESKKKADRALEIDMEKTVMYRSQQEYALQASAADERRKAAERKLQDELEMQIKYTQMVRESQKELDGILSGLSAGGLF